MLEFDSKKGKNLLIPLNKDSDVNEVAMNVSIRDGSDFELAVKFVQDSLRLLEKQANRLQREIPQHLI